MRRAEAGLGDGTVYATAAGSFNTLADAQTNKRFQANDVTEIADMGSDIDDLYNGCLLYFPVSGNRYHVVDYQAANDVFSVFETPAAIDVGTAVAFEVRRTLYGQDLLAANPALMACDGLPSVLAKIRAANVALTLDVCLPNLIGQGGYEELAAVGFPSTTQAAGLWWSTSGWTVRAAGSPLGSRSGNWDSTVTAADGFLYQRVNGTLRKGRRYRLVMKLNSIGGTSGASALRLALADHDSAVPIDADWGGATSYVDLGNITTTAAWAVIPDLIPDFESGNIRLTIQAIYANRGAATDLIVDEVSLWEVVPVSALGIFSHNWDGTAGPLVRGYYAPPSRTGITSDDYVDVLAAATIAGSSDLIRTWAVADPPTAAQAFPIYRISLAALGGRQHEVGEILLAQAWPWLTSPELAFDPDQYVYDEKRVRAISGSEVRMLYSKARVASGQMKFLPSADAAVWNGLFRERHLDAGEPFAVYWSGILDTPVLFKNLKSEIGLPFEVPNYRSTSFEWGEVL